MHSTGFGCNLYLQVESVIARFLQLRWYDVIDILVVTYIVVWLYSWVKGTRAFRVLLGLGLVMTFYLMASYWGLFLTVYALEWLGQAVLIFVLIIFAPEIRQVLEQLNPLRIWRKRPAQSTDYQQEILKAAAHLADHSTGALIVLERQDPIRELIRGGVRFDSEVHREILVSIFQLESPLHDGAVWIQEGRLHQAGVFLPLSKSDLPMRYGSRHRAAVGLSEVSDALVISVSEERGEISLADAGRLEVFHDLDLLQAELRREMEPAHELPRPTWRTILLKEWRMKLASLLFVMAVWFVLAGQQDTEEIFSVPIIYERMPAQLQLSTRPPQAATIHLSGPRRSLAYVEPSNLTIRVDLSGLQPGANFIPIDPDQIFTPPQVSVTQIQPQQLEIEARAGGS